MAVNKYPRPKHHYRVEWGGTNMGFSEVTGLSVETNVIEYRDGLTPQYSPIKMPGMQKYGNITLKRGVVDKDNEFFEWWNSVSLNTIQRRDITVSLLNEAHDPIAVWKVKNAFPVKVTAPDLNAGGNGEVAIEALEVAHEGLTFETP